MRPVSGMVVLLALAVACAICTSGEPLVFNPDDLPTIPIPLPDGKKVLAKRWMERLWRVVDWPELAQDSNLEDPNICFEGKFASLEPPDKLKMVEPPPPGPGVKEQLWATIVVDELLRRRAAGYNRNDNLWICGTLRRPKPRVFVFIASDIQKLASERQRWEKQLEKFRQQHDAESLIALGRTIGAQAKDFLDRGFEDFAVLANLANRAVREGLTLKEEALNPEDFDALFDVAKQWRDLLNEGARFHRIVENILKKNPEHPNAAKVAEEEWHWVKREGRWMSGAEADEIDKENAKLNAAEQARKKAREEELERLRQSAIQDRPALLAAREADLRTADPKARQQALLALGEEAKTSLDAGFGLEAVDILVNCQDSAALQALGTVIKSTDPLVRCQAYEALAWRGRQDASALDCFQAALLGETERDTAFEAVAAAGTLSAAAAAKVLVKCLDNPNARIQEEIMSGLRTVTKQPFLNKQEWQAWWSQNKDNLK